MLAEEDGEDRVLLLSRGTPDKAAATVPQAQKPQPARARKQQKQKPARTRA